MNFVKLGGLVSVLTGKLDANAASPDGQYPFFTCAREPLRISSWSYDMDAVLVAGNGDLNVKYYNGKFDAYQRTYILSPKDGCNLDARYLYHFMEKYLDKLRSQSIGGIIKYIKLGMITEAVIPLPPLSEQKRIAAILDKADQLRQKRKQAIALLDSLTQSIFLEMFGDPVSNPKGWKMASIFDVSTKVTDGTHDTPRRTTAGVPFLTGKNIRPYIVDLSQIEYVDEQTHKEIFRRCNPEMGDVLYTNIGAGVGAAALNRLTYEFSLKNVALIKPNRKLMTGEFLELVLNNSKFKSRLLEQYAQGGAQKFLGLATIKKIQIPVPPLNDLSSLTSRLMILEPIRISLQDRIRRAHALFSSLQHHAFSGQL